MAEIINPTPAVILAGGQGSRIGGGKPGRLLAGRTLLDHAIAKAFGYSPVVALSVGSDAYSPPDNISMICDPADISGPVAGLAAALRFASDAHILVIPCDTPFLPSDLLLRLQDGIGHKAAAMAQYRGRLHPACSLWRAEAAGLLPDYLAQGRRSLMGFAEYAGYIAVEWPEQATDPFFNINTANDLAEAERIFARSSPQG